MQIAHNSVYVVATDGRHAPAATNLLGDHFLTVPSTSRITLSAALVYSLVPRLPSSFPSLVVQTVNDGKLDLENEAVISDSTYMHAHAEAAQASSQ